MFEVVVVKERAEQGAESDDVCLPGEMLVANPARGKREHDRENNPAHRDPRRAERFLKNPDHHGGSRPGVGHARQSKMPFVRGAEPGSSRMISGSGTGGVIG